MDEIFYLKDNELPPEISDTPFNRWIIRRSGEIRGYYGPLIKYEDSIDSYGDLIKIPIYNYGIWKYSKYCNSTLENCDKLKCPIEGKCNKGNK